MQSSSRPRRRRSLRHTVLLWLGIGFLLLIGLQYQVTNSFLSRQLIEEESRGAFERVRNLQHILAVAAEDLDATADDWSQWDDTYAFVSGEAPDYAAINLTVETFARLRLRFVLILDQHGRAIFAQSWDEASGELGPLAQDIARLAEAGGVLAGDRPGEIVSGLIAGASGIHLVSSNSVVDSSGVAQPRGRLIMGRSMDSYVVPTMSRMTQMPVALVPIDAGSEEAPVQEVLYNDAGDELHLHSGGAHAFTTLQDVLGRPVARLQTNLPRPVETALSSAQPYLIAATVLIALIFFGVTLFVLEYKIVSPMQRLAAIVAGIGSTGSRAVRVENTSRETEFETLGAAINGMLDQIEAQQSLARDRDAALEANRLKSEFLATMSHEIRTPMNGVLGTCELLQYTQLDARQRQLVDTLMRSARSLLDILNDILDFSKIESGKLQLEAAPFSPAEVIHNASAPFALAAQVKGVELEVRIDPEVPPWLLGDSLRLRQVITNLLSNAVKFTDTGSIAVSCAVERADAHRVDLRLSVADTGIGIAAAVQPQIFEPFTQAEPGTAHRYGGTGLGLAIVKRLVALMNGRLTLQSAPGAGSTFAVTIALQRLAMQAGLPQKIEAGAVPAVPVAGALAVLLAEDNAVSREVLTEMLEHIGCAVTAVENGAEAIAAAAQRKFDAVLLDCQMPVMDGHAAAAELRALERAAAQPPAFIVALTADATPENRERCFASGMDAVVTKPITHLDLREIIARKAAAAAAS